VAASITRSVSVKVIEGLVSVLGMWTNVAVTEDRSDYQVAVKVMGSVEPQGHSNTPPLNHSGP
jgi:hypothetical protein